MGMEIAIAILKALSAFLGGGLGILGLLHNFKTPDGGLTRAGKCVLAMILISMTAGIAWPVFEASQTRTLAQTQMLRLENLLKETRRAALPITELKLSFSARLPDEVEPSKGYLKKLDSAVVENLKRLETEDHDAVILGLNISSVSLNGPKSFVVRPDSPIWPRGEYAVIGNLATFLNFSVYIHKTPIAIEHFDALISTAPGHADFIAMSFSQLWSIAPNEKGRKNSIDFDLQKKSISINGQSEYEKQWWRSNGKIASFVDLYGSQIFLVIGQTRFGTGKPSASYQAAYRALEEGLTLDYVRLDFGEGREIWIKGSLFRKGVMDSSGRFPLTVFAFVFPDESQGFSNLGPSE